MTATLNDMNATKRLAASDESAEADAAKELVRLARERGLCLTGPAGMLKQLTKPVIEEMQSWQQRPLDATYAAIFIDAIVVKVRDGQVANRPIYAAIGVSLEGEKDILGLWAGTGGEGAKFWMSVLTDIRNRGVKDV